VLYLHGGGCVMGSPANSRDLLARISRVAGVSALALDYRLAPEHPFPAAVEDATAAYQWLLEKGFAPEHVVIGGDSAGGGVAYQALASWRNAGVPLPAAAFFLSPQTDFLHYDGESYVTRAHLDPYVTKKMARQISSQYAAGARPDADRSLLCLVDADLRGFPPMLIQVGDHELLLSDALRLGDLAREAGVDVTVDVWDQMWHVFQNVAALVPEAQRAIDKLGHFIHRHLGLG